MPRFMRIAPPRGWVVPMRRGVLRVANMPRVVVLVLVLVVQGPDACCPVCPLRIVSRDTPVSSRVSWFIPYLPLWPVDLKMGASRCVFLVLVV